MPNLNPVNNIYTQISIFISSHIIYIHEFINFKEKTFFTERLLIINKKMSILRNYELHILLKFQIDPKF